MRLELFAEGIPQPTLEVSHRVPQHTLIVFVESASLQENTTRTEPEDGDVRSALERSFVRIAV